MKKWAIFIDIEGFGSLYQQYSDLAYKLLIGLVTDVHYIMENVYPEPNLSLKDATLFLIAHQFGDGVIISPVPLGKGLDLFKPICISIALLRTTAMRRGLAKAAISYGGMVDYRELYPKEIQDKIDKSGSFINTNSGVITILTSMGEGLIRSYELSKKASGPLLMVDSVFEEQIKNLKLNVVSSNKDYYGIDWINSEVELVNEIIRKIDTDVPTCDQIVKSLKIYLDAYNVPDEWRENAFKLLRRSSLKKPKK